MKHQALLSIQTKLKLAIILVYFSVAIDWQISRKRVARGVGNYEVLKLCYI